MIELLVTIVLAGIIFAAMVPFFANALQATSRDAQRNDAQTITVDRIEQVRLLDYDDITQANLNSPPSPASSFGDGRFGPIYTVASGPPFDIVYDVAPQTNAQKVTVHVTRSGSNYTTTMSTVVKNPAPNEAVVTAGPTSTALPTEGLTITASFKDWRHVTYPVPYLVRVGPVPANSALPTPVLTIAASGLPTASSTTVTWTGLSGGAAYTYTVSCHSSRWNNGLTPLVSPPFRLLKSARLKFDTNPGGS